MTKFKNWLACSLLALCGVIPASAFTTNDSVTIFDAYNSAFLVGGYYPGWWTGAEEIEMAEDAYDNLPTPARQNIVSNACNQFIAHHTSNWTSGSGFNNFNDDISWAVIAFARGYLITGSTTFRNVAKSNYDGMFSRAWDTNFTGGGLWWNTDNSYKNAAINGPGAVAACYLYAIYGDSSYLNKAKDCYAWERRVLFDPTTGLIHDGINSNTNVPSGGALTYNQGTFIGAANLLYRATGLPYYYQDAILAGKYTQNSMTSGGILPEYSSGSDLSGFNGIFARWMAHFARDQNLWLAFGPWLTTNANAAWSVRNTNNLAWQKWKTPLGTNVPGDWGCSAAVVVMQVADASPADALQITPSAGFTAVSQRSLLPNSTIDLVLTNTGAAPLNWSLANTSAWLNVSSSSGTLPVAGVASVTVSLIPSATTNLTIGRYYSSIVLTNLDSRVVANRLFTMVIAGGDAPIAMTGYNAAVLAANNATASTPNATAFDIPNNYCLYQAGLNGGTRGLPPDGVFTSQLDTNTVFQFQPYGSTNALVVGYNYPSSATLTLATPRAYNSISILAASANGNGPGTLVLNFTNGTSSPVLNFSAQDWFNNATNVAIQGIGRLKLVATFGPENNGSINPRLYQTTLNLAALGLNQAIASITFTKPANSGTQQDCGVFAVSGAVMPDAPNIVQQPVSVTNNLPAQGATFSVVASGLPPLSYQWYYSSNGSPGTYVALDSNTNSSLSLSPTLQATNAGSYFVVISNTNYDFASVMSSVATLVVYRAPVITQQPAPTNLFRFTGGTGSWSVAVSAALPVNYYWRMNGTAFPPTNNPTLQLGNLQIANSGNYSVVISNAFGAVTSSVVSLAVVTASYPFRQAVLADHALGYWRLDETNGTIAHDYVGGNNGAYSSRVLLGQTGNKLLDTHYAARFGSLSTTNSCVTNIALNFSTATGNGGFSVEAWVNGGAQTTDAGLVSKGYGSGGEQFNLDCGGGSHGFRFFVRDAGGGAHVASSSVLPNNQWRHVVGVCDQSNGAVRLYVDGVSVAQGTITPYTGILPSASPVSIGSRQSGAATSYDNQFVGYMEEVAIYGYPLSSNQVQAHFVTATNRAPTFRSNPFTVARADAGQSYSATVATNASDPNGDAITFSKITGPTWLSVAANGTLAGTPLSPDAGDNSFIVRATDPGGLFGTATMNLVVLPAPSITISAIMQGNDFLLNWTGGIAPYQVQISSNLLSTDWQNLGPPLGTNTLSLAPSNSAAFYRIYGQ